MEMPGFCNWVSEIIKIGNRTWFHIYRKALFLFATVLPLSIRANAWSMPVTSNSPLFESFSTNTSGPETWNGEFGLLTDKIMNRCSPMMRISTGNPDDGVLLPI